MKRLLKPFLLGIVGLVLATAPWRPAAAQQIKPVAVVSVANIDEMLSDAVYLTKAAGVPEFGALIPLFTAPQLVGLDKSRPAGVYATIEMGLPKVVGFVPLTNLKMFLERHKDKIGEPKDAGDGVLEIGGDRPTPVFIKEQKGWLFISNSATNLGNLPDNPARLLEGMDKQYNLAARFNAQNLPPQMKKVAISFLKDGFEKSLRDGLGDEGNVNQRKLQEKVARRSLESFVKLIEDADKVTLGLAIDNKSKSAFLDLSLTAVPGSEIARQLNTAAGAKTSFAGFQLPEAAATLSLTTKMTKDDIEVLEMMIDGVRQEAAKELKKENMPERTRAAVKAMTGDLFDLIKATVRSGKLDGGAALMLKPKAFTFVAGGHIADGAALERILKTAADLLKNEPDFPGIKFNSSKHRDVQFHTMAIPIPADEDEARKIFGESLEVVIGTGGKSLYVGFGQESLSTLKKVIDLSAAGPKEAAGIELKVALAPILKFASSIEDDPKLAMLATALEKANGHDHISFSGKPIPNGYQMRLEVEDGILLLVGEGVKGAIGGGRGF